jgi:ribose transport system substrate-binding protein
MKHKYGVVALVLMAFVLTACERGTPGTTDGTEGEAFSLCVVHNNADHPSIAAIVRGMNEEAEIYGAEITYFDPAFDPQKQLSMIDDCIARDSDVLAINAVDPEAVVPGIERAVAADVPVIMHNAGTTPEGAALTKTLVGTESYDQGYSVGSMMAEELGGEGNVVAILGFPGQIDVINRMNGLKDAWKDAGANFNLIAQQPADWDKDKALTVMTDLLTRHQDIDVVFGLDDPMALGALQAIKAAGREDEIAVYGVNGNKDACQAIQDGEMRGTALQLSDLVGIYTVRAAYDVVQGRQLPDQILAPTAPVTPDNVDQWMDRCW